MHQQFQNLCFDYFSSSADGNRSVMLSNANSEIAIRVAINLGNAVFKVLV
jgi:hypothetical protein